LFMWAVVMTVCDNHSCGATLQLTGTAAVGRHAALATATSTRVRSDAVATATVTHPVAAANFTSATTTTGTSTTTAGVGCGGVTRCLDHTDCAQCLEAINATSGFPHTLAQFYSIDTSTYRANDVALFRGFQLTASCSTSATPPGILHPALQELNDEVSCDHAHGMVVGTCLVTRRCHRLHVLCGPRLSAVPRCGVCRSCRQRRQQRQ